MLSIIQLLLLENLSYTYDSSFPYNYLESYIGYPLQAFIDSIDLDDFEDHHIYNSFLTGKDWKDIIEAIANDPKLLQLKLITTFTDHLENGGGAFSYLVINHSTKEAIIVFKGTQGSKEWIDNFKGGGYTACKDRVSTPCQINAYSWYQEIYQKYHLDHYRITIIGHSKGGNKAKYITILDPSIERCISFDGQGFSDAFFTIYHNQIVQHQNKITNIALDNDFVNILLNDIGKKEYYQGFNIGNGNGGFLENHCPNSFFDFQAGKTPIMIQTDKYRIKGLDIADDFFNSLSRNFSHESRTTCLEMIGQIYINAISKNDLDYTIDLLLSSEYKHFTAYTFAYFVEYLQAKSIQDELLELINFLGLEDINKIIKIILLFIDSPLGDSLISILLKISDRLPDSILQLISKEIYKKTDYSISIYQLMFLIDTILDIPNYQRMFEYLPSGEDLKIN